MTTSVDPSWSTRRTVIRSLLQQFPHWFPFISHERTACVCDSFVRMHVGHGYNKPDLLFPLSLSLSLFHRISFPLILSTYMHTSITTYLYLFVSFLTFLANISRFSLSFVFSLFGIINIIIKCRYLYNTVESISGFSEENRMDANTHGARTTTEDTARVVSIFYHLGVCKRVVRADFIGAAAPHVCRFIASWPIRDNCCWLELDACVSRVQCKVVFFSSNIPCVPCCTTIRICDRLSGVVVLLRAKFFPNLFHARVRTQHTCTRICQYILYIYICTYHHQRSSTRVPLNELVL